MNIVECAICGQRVDRSLVCRKCQRTHDLGEAWAKALIEDEKRWRNMQSRDNYHGVIVFSDYRVTQDGEEYDGWDVLDGEMTGRSSDVFLNAMGVNDSYFRISEEATNEILEYQLYQLADEADWTQGELNAMFVSLFAAPGNERFTSQHGAEHLTKMEGKMVTAEAYRRRLSDARKKLKSSPDLLHWLEDLLRELRTFRDRD